MQPIISVQPPSRGCVLKLRNTALYVRGPIQPPSRGCVLKPINLFNLATCSSSAAFARLCVETTIQRPNTYQHSQPPSRGCVLKPFDLKYGSKDLVSRLRAAVC